MVIESDMREGKAEEAKAQHSIRIRSEWLAWLAVSGVSIQANYDCLGAFTRERKKIGLVLVSPLFLAVTLMSRP